MRIALKIILGLIVFGFIGGCIYFVGGVSATYPANQEIRLQWKC
ncbi:hypothetical protein M2273_006026 [Mucilaginibacter lappiensis]